jgi:hypothetical protein
MVFGFGKPQRGGQGAGRIPALPGAKVDQDYLETVLALARAPKVALPFLTDLAGKVNNLPNTAIGVAAGVSGHIAGQIFPEVHKQGVPRVSVGGNAVEFRNNPVAKPGAVTLGNVTIYGDDPYDPNNHGWDKQERIEGHSVQDHEKPHTYQGQQLGPLYLPSNLLGGLNAMIHGQDWHGDANWNERGPQLNPPRPWAPKRRRP